MKRWLARVLLLAALLALATWAWKVLFPTPEQAIRKRLAQLAQAATVSPKEGELARALNAQLVTIFFSGDIEITLEVPGRFQYRISGRDQLQRDVFGARSAVSNLTVEFIDVGVSVAADRTSATVNLTARGSTPADKSFLVQELKLHVKKIGRDWLIDRVETVKTLL